MSSANIDLDCGHFGHTSLGHPQQQAQITILTGAVPDPTVLIHELQHLTISRGAVPISNLTHVIKVLSIEPEIEQIFLNQDDKILWCQRRLTPCDPLIEARHPLCRTAAQLTFTNLADIKLQCHVDGLNFCFHFASSTGS